MMLIGIFGLLGGNNDINVVERSPLLAQIFQEEDHDLTFEVNDYVYPWYYLFIDGIYLPCICLVQPIHEPENKMQEHFTKCQKSAKKKVEKALWVLQARWKIVKNPVKQWDLETISNIMMTCIIIHNMIIEDDRD